ncbi:MAG: nickel-dependent lactate racemase [Spirochaetales bacterium]|jgi:nickel-dependent lactate racemase|nr:nickel-dependent lactate racemase [Spirochaetales bacterium]
MAETTKITIPFGMTRTISFNVPSANLSAVLTAPDVAPAPDLQAEVDRALSRPIGCGKLRDLVRGKKNAVILADDNTRLTPTSVIIPQILDEMNAGGMRDGNITLLIALGTHRFMSDKEILLKYGEQVVQRVKIVNHDYRDFDGLVALGETRNGTPISVNRILYDADFSLGVGSVYPHHIPGFAGGAKIVQPGVSGEATTGATHLLGCRIRPSYLGTISNPVREELNAVARSAKMNYIFNAVQNEQGRTVQTFFGDLEAAFLAAAKKSKETLSAPFTERADIVVAGSFPADIEFWQAHKTLYPADAVAKPGGTIILVTPCPEGIAVTHPEMTEYTAWSAKEIDEAVRSVKIRDVTSAALAIAWALVREGRQISLVSTGLSASDAAKLGFVPFDSVDAALEDAFKRHGETARVTVLPRSPETLPVKV